RRRHTRSKRDWSSDVCSSDLVSAEVLSGNTLYIGGSFTHVGPATGGFVPVDTATALPSSGFPKVAGTVYATVSDGSGGWYVGGRDRKSTPLNSSHVSISYAVF